MRPALVKMPVATAILNLGVDAINNLATSGALLWVFNLAANPRGKISSWRFFLPELEARANGDSKRFSGFEMAQIVDEILSPGRATWPAGALDQLFQLSRPARISLHAEIFGENGTNHRRGAGNYYAREPLVGFLERRWLGNLERSAQR